MVITKREILVSIAIVAIMLFFGIVFSNVIEESNMQRVKDFQTAVRVDTEYAFDYGMRTSIGNTLAYGLLTVCDPVSLPELNESYLYISRTKERYTQHTRVVSDGKNTRTEVYWSWDNVDHDTYVSEMIEFLGKEIRTSNIGLPSATSLHLSSETIDNGLNIRNDYWYESRNIRYSYKFIPSQFMCTLRCSLSDGGITGNIEVYKDQTIEETISSQTASSSLSTTFFWIVWVILIIGILYAFFVMENRWIE